jgi:hypothetical protein
MVQVVVDITGLCCAAPAADALDVILVNDPGMEHQPRLVIATELVEPGTRADEVVAVPDGATYFVWSLRDLNLAIQPSRNPGPVTLKSTGAAPPRPRDADDHLDACWIPSLTGITSRRFDDNHRARTPQNGARVAAAAHLAGGGTLESRIGPDRIWHIGDRISQVIAEGMVYRFEADGAVTLSTASWTVKLHDAGAGSIRISLSNLPAFQMGDGSSIPHFESFYALLEGDGSGPRPHAPKASGRPVQCGTARP